VHDHLLPRIGTFFILIGCGLFTLFIGSVVTKEINLLYLLLTLASLFLGYLLHRTAPRPEPTRFSSIRKANQRFRQRNEEKKAQKEQLK
jgi:hypothetical protein